MTANILREFLKKQEKPNFVQQFCQSLVFASQRTKEYIGFSDPESKLKINSSILNDIFLMSYINRSIQAKLPGVISCTKMTSEQAVLLGADWVWAVHDLSSNNPKLQIVVQVVHLESKEPEEDESWAITETMQVAQAESTLETKPEKMIKFCSSIGSDCYGLFLFFGYQDDPKNIYGVLSNSFHTATEDGQEVIDSRSLEDNIRKTKIFISLEKILEMVLQRGNEADELKPICVKFTQ
ncbi:rab15 effector protein [Callorhinchus milii]|uniref:Rab15 effector protein n=1 Tax=Callorhinchus milii TaxID=7868 RepID=V9KMM7_CALMI|nr:rab15 effector protein [Callorhinchus milii]|eukprot:gi/632941684/ref/XP_007885996.1/ PREDICTED: rab15 effector protein-like [Callorhinchus milii]